MSTINLVEKKEISKATIEMVVSDLSEKIDTDEIDPLLLEQHFKAIEIIKEKIKEKLREASIRQASKYPEKSIMLYGAEFKIGEFGTKYNYFACKDPVWNELKQRADEIKDDMDRRQKFLQTLKGETPWINPDTGEICTLYPPSKTSTTSVSCSIK